VLQQCAGGQLVDLHISDLLSNQLPSHFDYTSWYDLLVFRRLAAAPGSNGLFLDNEHGTVATARQALASIDTSPVGFAVFDRVLLTVHPADCLVREFFATRLAQMTVNGNGASRLPPSAADLMLRIVNHMVDGYLELRRLLTRQLTTLQQTLLGPRSRRVDWTALLESRNTLHQLEDVCEDQRSAIQEWIDSLDEWPSPDDTAARRDRELLRVRSRDVLEHIERVLSHVRRLESSIESAVQMHFSMVGQRTNDIMRTLTVLTAIFLPLNLITGFFGMNFDALPLIHSPTGFWVAAGLMVLLAERVLLAQALPGHPPRLTTPQRLTARRAAPVPSRSGAAAAGPWPPRDPRAPRASAWSCRWRPHTPPCGPSRAWRCRAGPG
jgi:magnesium transporter